MRGSVRGDWRKPVPYRDATTLLWRFLALRFLLREVVPVLDAQFDILDANFTEFALQIVRFSRACHAKI